MSRIDPTRFWPRETGRGTSVSLPGQRSPMVEVVCIHEGMVVARSFFSPEQDHSDDIRRPSGQLLLAFNLSGGMTITTQSAEHSIGCGEGWAIRPGTSGFHRHVARGQGCANIVLSLTLAALPDHVVDALERAFPQPDLFRRLSLPVPGRAELSSLFDSLDTPAAMIRKEGQCYALIGHVLEELEKDPPASHPITDPKLLVTRTRAVLVERLAERISLADLARSLGVSHVTLNRAFRSETGHSVFGYLRGLRLEKAERLVKSTDRSLTEIAFECGFSSPSHLSKAWRERHGTSPRISRRIAAAQRVSADTRDL